MNQENQTIVKIDKWYNRHTISWVIQFKDKNDSQVGEAFYCGNKDEANRIYNDMTKEYGLIK